MPDDLPELPTECLQSDSEIDGFFKFNEEVMRSNYIKTVQSASDSMSQYLNEPNIDGKADPLAYWKGNQHVYPALCKVCCTVTCLSYIEG